MFSLESFKKKYPVEVNELLIKDRKFEFYLPSSIDAFINEDNPMDAFPLWAKIWPAGLVLADYVCSVPVDPEKRWLEIGAGIGVVGIAAAAFGHRVTVSECDPAALDFIHANAHINRCENVKIECIDWKDSATGEKFERIVGSEVLYKDSYFPWLESIFENMLTPDGEILLASEMRKSAFRLLEKLRDKFKVQVSRRALRSGGEKLPIFLYRLTKNSV